LLIIIVIAVVMGMWLFSKDAGSGPERVPAEAGGGVVQNDPQPLPNEAQSSKGDWSLEEVAGKPGEQPLPKPIAEATGKGDWSIEEVPTKADGETPPPLPANAPPGAELRKTTKGDWVIEEAGGNTKPAELKLSDPKDPKTTKKGDWELEVD
jgi:hypothetical protein